MKSLFLGFLLVAAGVPIASNAQKEKVPDQALPTHAAGIPASCLSPEMPRASLRHEESGTVTVSILVGIDGAVKSVKVSRSSGYLRLDETARNAALTCRFLPYMRDGVAIEWWANQQYIFSLKN